MSHFSVLSTALTDTDALCAALADVGYREVEVHDTAQPLHGYRGDRREHTAHVIVRRRHVGRLSNDIGFLHGEDGRFTAAISDYDRRRHDAAWLDRLTARHAYHVTAARLAEEGFHLAEETTERDGTVRMVLRRVR
ncbi:DUF1257 domain-containing protein [Streptomyces sp. WMMC500]|uniref:DUF1257 domain-containing protein n=1 Tax=Streptomyces sp. WMMC500 TaxID=3015154 RepID=UPI00248B7EC1|nr:DUF1257 domain-containing protein [Streptomyces sp. WMMC500]WBB60278.1 DUF1257 domain-containing protein [Streptomyces sp. WMMC500]